MKTWIYMLVVTAMAFMLTNCGEDAMSPEPNQSPAITSVTAALLTLAPGQTTTVTVAASDPDGDNLSYSYTALGGTVVGATNTATFTAGQNAGNASVTVLVSDGQGGSVNGSVSLNIAQLAPTVNISAQSVPAGGGGECLLFTAVPQEELVFNSVKITNPIAEFVTFNIGGVTVVANQAVALQDPGACYTKRSGVYTFEFTGTRPGGGAFTATSSYTQQ